MPEELAEHRVIKPPVIDLPVVGSELQKEVLVTTQERRRVTPALVPHQRRQTPSHQDPSELPSGPRPVRDDETILAVTGNYLLDPAIGDQDGYTMLGKHQIVSQGTPPDLKDLMLAALEQAGDSGIAPAVTGRICEEPATRPAPCLAVAR